MSRGLGDVYKRQVWNFVKKRQRQGMGFYGIRRRKPQIERTAAGGFVAA